MIDTLALIISHGMLVILILRVLKVRDPEIAREQKKEVKPKVRLRA